MLTERNPRPSQPFGHRMQEQHARLMDMTTAPTSTASWELLAQLAQCAQAEGALAEASELVRMLADLVARHMQVAAGCLELIEEDQVLATASWGEQPCHDPAPLELRADGMLLGRLALGGAGAAGLDPAFATALTAQMALLLVHRQRQVEAELVSQIYRLVSSNLELIGILETRTLIQAVLTRAAPLLGVAVAAIYTSREEQEGTLGLLAAGEGDFTFPLSDELVVHAAKNGPQVGLLAPGQARRRQAERPHHNSSKARHAMALPLRSQGELTGVVVLILNEGTQEPSTRLRRMANTLTTQMALLVRNGRLFSQQQQRARELFVLYENSQEITTNSQLESMLSRATENIALALSADYCAVKLLDAAYPDTLRTVSTYSEAGRTQSGRALTLISGAAALLAQVEEQSPLLISEAEKLTPPNPLVENLIANGCRSALVVPLLVKEETIGLLMVGYVRARRPIAQAERNLAQVLAAQVATAILNRRLFLAEQDRAAELELLQHISRNLTSDLSLDETLSAILDGVEALARYGAARVALIESHAHEPQVVAQRGLANPEMALGLTSWLTRQGRMLRMNDMQQPPAQVANIASLSKIEFETGGVARSYLGVPLRLREELIGTLELFAPGSDTFGDNDARLLNIVAGPAAQALANASRYTQADAGLRTRLEQLRALQRVSSQLATTLDQTEILAYVLEQALRVTGASSGLIALRSAHDNANDNAGALYSLGGQQAAAIYHDSLNASLDDTQPTYVIVEAIGIEEAIRQNLLGITLAPAAATAWRAMEQREPELSDSLSAEEQALIGTDDVRSALAAPIFYQAGIYGVLLLLGDRTHTFDYDAVEFLRALTHQTAVGIGNAQRYHEVEQLYRAQKSRAAILNNVLEIGQALRANRSLESLLEQVGYSAMEAANYRVALFCLSDQRSPGMLRPSVAAGIPRSELEQMSQTLLPERLATSYLDPRFRMGRCYFVPAAEAQELEAPYDLTLFSYTLNADTNASGDAQSGDRLCVPLYSTDSVLLGLMLVSDPLDHQRPTARRVEPLELFADQAAIAIENAWLIRDADARAEQMAALFHVGSAATSTTNLTTLLERVYQEIVAFLGTPSIFYIVSHDAEQAEICFELLMHNGQCLVEAHKQTMPRGGLIEEVILKGQALLVPDLRAERRHKSLLTTQIPEASEVRSWLSVPLVSQGRTIGVLSIQDFQPHVFTERDQQFLSALANQLAVAMERATLFDERERRLAELHVINRIGEITSSTLDLRQMLLQTYEQLRAFLSLDAFLGYIYDRERELFTLTLEIDGELQSFSDLPVAPHPDGLLEYIISTRHALQFSNLEVEAAELGFDVQPFGTGQSAAAWLGVPLIVGDGQVVGLVAVMSYTPAVYGERELAFMTMVANQLALGVQNARLLERAQQQVAQFNLLNRVSVQASAATDVIRIYQIVVDAMAEAAEVDQARLVIYNRAAGVAPAVAEYRHSGMLQDLVIPMRENPAIALLDERRAPLVVPDAQNDPLMALSHQLFRDLDIRSIALVPLVANEVVIGAVGLDFVGRDGEFSTSAIELCQTIANQTSTAIGRAKASAAAASSARALEQKVGALSTLLNAASILSSLLRPDEVLNKLMELVSRRLNVSTVALWTITSEQMLVPAAFDGISNERSSRMRVPVGQGLTGQVAATGNPLIIVDVNSSGGSLYPNYQRDNNLVSFMGVPVVYRDQILGVLSVMTSYRREFTLDEQELLSGLADQAATALQTARLFEEREQRIRELSTISSISTAVNATLDIQVLLEQLHQGIGEVIDVSTSLIALYDEQRNIINFPVAYDRGRIVELMTGPLGHGVNGWVIRTAQPLLLRSAEEGRQMGLEMDLGQHTEDGSIEESFLVAPIIFGGRVLGVINIQSYEQRAFDANDLRFLTTAANQAAVALNNARLFSEARQRATEMTTLFEVTQNLSSSLNMDETQHLVADAAVRLLGADTSLVIRFNNGKPTRKVFVDQAQFRDDLQLTLRVDGMTQRLLESGQPLAISDLQVLDDANPDALKLGMRSVLGLIIGSHDERMGVLWVGQRQPYDWSEHQMSLGLILANQAGQALKSAQLFELEQQRRLMADTLRDVAQSFTTTLALREIQTLILDQLVRVVHYDSAAVLLRSDEHGDFGITETRGLTDAQLLNTRFSLEEQPLFQAMAANLRPVLVEDTHDASAFAPFLELGWQCRSWIGAPLLVDNKLIGILAIGTAEVGVYDDEMVEVTFTLANQASQAIQNADLFDQLSNLAADLERRVLERTAEVEHANRQLSQEKDRLEAVHAITLELTTQLDLGVILRQALEMISDNLAVTRGSIMLRDTQDGALFCRAVLDGRGQARSANIPMIFGNGEGLAGWVMERQESVNIADVLDDERWVQAPGRADEVRAVAAVPLKTTDEALGVLVLSSTTPGYFSDSQMNLLGTIASVIAAAVANAQLYSFINDLAGTNASLLEEQREESSKSAAVLRSVSEGVIVLDTSEQITLFNPAAEQVLEISSEMVVGHTLSIFETLGSDVEAAQRYRAIYDGLANGLKQVRQNQQIYTTHIDLEHPAQVIAINLATVAGPHGQTYGNVAVLRDITREIEADHAKRQFISDVSHELRTPLTSVKGYVDVLLLGGGQGLSQDQVSYLQIIKNNTNRLRDLIEDILEFSRPDSKKKLVIAPVEIPGLIHEVAQALHLEAERKQMNVSIDVPEHLPAVMADQRRINQVLTNLFSNAVKYTFEGGNIYVRAFLNPGNMLQVEVEDNGVGMTAEQRKKLFRPFYRADNPLRDIAGGTGLGLAIAKQIVEQHGGEMWVQSEHGKGSIFSFILPLQQAKRDDAEGDAA
ncbi:GAF domain-containing protein [Candidatus Viridilinea mediisalina]|uniref:histidine kinase n=1 Tax=Candidatus Viridilinea mediisalina TaxID=2024553 RepID=A0A2A6RIW7_9CHLR|nr:GAF domain-containing protein [Candidatus Viridilinea mediisalina]PDW02962.1 histidine kinase [Candidatus Viridilinea mediisalina]